MMKYKQGLEVWTSLQIRPGGNTGYLGIFTETNTADRTYTFPDKNGTVAMLSDVGGVSLTDDNATNASYYPVLATTAGGSTLKTSSTKISFNPSTGALSSGSHVISNASSVPFLTSTRSDLSNSVTLTQSAANKITSSAQIILPNDPTAPLETSTKQYVDNNLSSVQPSAVAAAIGPWTSYTPTWTSTGTQPTLGNGTATGYWRRNGDSMDLIIFIQLGSTSTIGTGNYIFSIPVGYTIDSTKLTHVNVTNLGSLEFYNSGSTTIFCSVINNSLTNSLQGFGQNSVSASWPAAPTNGCYYAIKATIPISQFSANINLLTNFTEYAYNTSLTTANDTTSFGYGSQGILLQSFAPGGINAVSKTIQFTQPIQATDLIQLEVFNGVNWIPASSTPWIFNSVNTSLYGTQLLILNSTQVRVDFFSQAYNGAAWSAYVALGYKWRVRKISNGNFAQGSPSVPFTIGDGSTLSYTLTHNLGVSDVDVACWELTGAGRKVDSGITITNPTQSKTQVVLTFTTAPATNSIRAIVFSSGGTQAAGDMLSNIANAELQITTTATATLRTWHNCTATSANYALTLPPAASCSGQFIGIRIDPSSTYLVTITGNASELIDGQNTRIMWAGESCELKSNGVSWNKVGGRSIPMSGTLGHNGTNQTFAALTATQLTTLTSIVDGTPPTSFMVNASSEFVIQRPGRYTISLHTYVQSSNNSSTCLAALQIMKNTSTQIGGVGNYSGSATGTNSSCSDSITRTLAVNDIITINGFYSAGSFTTSYLLDDYTTHANNQFSVTEIPTW